MTTYTTIPNSDIDQDSPVTQPLMTALRDNPIAITEGSSGAPKIADAALGTTDTNTGRNWVLARNARATAGAIGTYTITSGSYTEGTTRTLSGKSGTWRAMGTASNSYYKCIASDESGCIDAVSFTHSATLHLRIS